MRKICIAPGETGQFKNWGEDLFLEEKAFPEKFPYGLGGYLSSMINNEGDDMGFAAYCRSQLMNCDPKFRQDVIYIFFLLLVKELIELKRCKFTFMRQATRLPNLSKDDVLNYDPINLNRYNRTFEVFKNMRGTSMFYQKAKKNVMALLRQFGSPTLFLTLSCAEFDWPQLLKEIVETVERRTVTDEYVESLSKSQKNKLISENYVQTTIHFQKRMDKLFTLMKGNFFKFPDESFHVDAYFFRIEFQMRGAPHLHSLLWLKNHKNEDAPSFWFNKDENDSNNSKGKNKKTDEEKIEAIEKFANAMILTSPDEMKCQIHDESLLEDFDCPSCKTLQQMIRKYQRHRHTFTCAKKHKTLTIHEHEGHGRMDGFKKSKKLSNISVCRFG